MAGFNTNPWGNTGTTPGYGIDTSAMQAVAKQQTADAEAKKQLQMAEDAKAKAAADKAAALQDTIKAAAAVKPTAAATMKATTAANTTLAPTILAGNTNLGAVTNAQAATIDQSKQDQFRQGQVGLAAALQAQAAGQGPSLAQGQLQQATDRNLAQALALQASTRGSTAGQGSRQIAQQTSAINGQAARDSAALRMQEQMSAQQQLAGVLDSSRGADIGLATNQAGLVQGANLANAGAQNASTLQQGAMNQQTSLANAGAQNATTLQQGAMNQQTSLANAGAQNAASAANLQSVLANNNLTADAKKFYLTAQMGLSNAEADRALTQSGQQIQKELGYAGQETQKQIASDAQDAQMWSSVLGGLGAVGAAAVSRPPTSDKRAKTNIKDGDQPVRDFLDALKAHQYEYKDKATDGGGTYISPMAQEMEKTALGKDMVIEGPDGKKMVDYGRAAGTMLASSAMLNDRVSQLERALKARKGS